MEFRLKFGFDADVPLDRNLASLNSDFDHLLIEVKIKHLFRIVIDVVESVSVEISKSFFLVLGYALGLQYVSKQIVESLKFGEIKLFNSYLVVSFNDET